MNNFLLGLMFGLVLCDVILFVVFLCCCNDDDDNQEELEKKRSWANFRIRTDGPARLPDAGINPEEKDGFVLREPGTGRKFVTRAPDAGIKIEKEEQDDFYTLNSHRFD